MILALLPAWLLTVAWHELGHVVGGWAVGGRFLLYVVGPFKWQRTPSGVHFGWNRKLNLAGGLAACLPLDDRALPRRIAVMVAAGPLSSLVLAALAFGLAGLAAERHWPLVQTLALLVAGLSGLIFLVTVWPGEAGGFKSDGRRFLALRRGDAAALQEAALLALTVRALAGARPALFDPAQVAAVAGLDDGSTNALYGQFNAYLYFADTGDFDRAQRHLDRVLAGEAALPGFMRDLARAEYAWLLAAHGGPEALAAAQAWLASAGACDFDVATRHRAVAAVRWAEGRMAEARVVAEAGLVALETQSLAPVKSAFAAEALETLRRRAGG